MDTTIREWIAAKNPNWDALAALTQHHADKKEFAAVEQNRTKSHAAVMRDLEQAHARGEHGRAAAKQDCPMCCPDHKHQPKQRRVPARSRGPKMPFIPERYTHVLDAPATLKALHVPTTTKVAIEWLLTERKRVFYLGDQCWSYQKLIAAMCRDTAHDKTSAKPSSLLRVAQCIKAHVATDTTRDGLYRVERMLSHTDSFINTLPVLTFAQVESMNVRFFTHIQVRLVALHFRLHYAAMQEARDRCRRLAQLLVVWDRLNKGTLGLEALLSNVVPVLDPMCGYPYNPYADMMLHGTMPAAGLFTS